MNRKAVIAVVAASGALFSAIAALLIASGALPVAEGVTMLATIGIFVPVYYVVVQRRNSRFTPDERTKRIDSRAITWSWVLTASFLSVLLAVDRFTEVAFTAYGVILYVLLFMISSRWIAYLILSRKGDVTEW